MKRFLGMIASLFLANSSHPTERIASEYVSIDCPAGDISLQLSADQTFVMSLKYWDEKTHSHTRTETLKGTWSYESNSLSLQTSSLVHYHRTTTTMKVGDRVGNLDSLTWESSAPRTFADGYVLVERGAVDDLLLSATPHD